MKKLISLVLVFMMVLSAVCAFAEQRFSTPITDSVGANPRQWVASAANRATLTVALAMDLEKANVNFQWNMYEPSYVERLGDNVLQVTLTGSLVYYGNYKYIIILYTPLPSMGMGLSSYTIKQGSPSDIMPKSFQSRNNAWQNDMQLVRDIYYGYY